MRRNTRLAALVMSFVGISGVPHFAAAQTDKVGYTLTFDDEFDGTSIDLTKWQMRYKWGEAQVNGELQAYVDDAFLLDGATLEIQGTHSPGQYAGQTFEYRSGMLASLFHQRYGWFEIRCKMPLGKGLWPAFWLLGENGTAGVNEIDVHEFLGDTANALHMTVHWGQSYSVGHLSDGKTLIGPDFTVDFHTIAVDWDAERIVWYVDGVEQFRHTGEGVPQVEMYIITNLAIGGNWPGAPDSTTSFPANYAVDYIRAYQRTSAESAAGAPGAAGAAATAGGAMWNVAGTHSNSDSPPSDGCGCRVAVRDCTTYSGIVGIWGCLWLARRRSRRSLR